MIECVPSTPAHIGTLATRMRDIDIAECAFAGMSPREALRAGVSTSETCWTVKIDGRPEAMFGVVAMSMLEGRGRIWMLMTDDGAKAHRAIVRFGHIYTAALARHYRVLENHVHARNDKAIRWLSRLGFHVGPVDVIGGQPMRFFVRMS